MPVVARPMQWICCAVNTLKWITPEWTTAQHSWPSPKNGTAANPVYGKDYAVNHKRHRTLYTQTWRKPSYPPKARTLFGLIWHCTGTPSRIRFFQSGDDYWSLRGC